MANTTSTSATHDALKNWNSLPDAAFIRQPIVQALFGCSASTVWRMVARGTLPSPRKVSGSRINGWQVGEVRKALAV